MKIKLFSALIIILLPVLAWAGLASAQTTRSGDNATVGSNEVIDSTLWAGGRNIDIAGTVNGDVFCGGQTVNISGTIHGDIICGAQTLNISGTVDGSVRAAAQTINISGSINRNLTAAGQTLTLETKGKIGEDASLAVQDSAINGSIGRDLSFASRTASVTGSVGRNIKGRVDNLSVASSGKIGGEISYTSNNDAAITQGAQIGGKVSRSTPPQGHSAMNSGHFKFLAAVAMLVTALLLVIFFPRTFHKVSEQGINSFGKSFLVGLVASIIAPIIILIAMISIVALPLALLAIAAWVLIVGLSGAFAAYYTGRLVWRQQSFAPVIMLVGGVILLLIRIIPVIGFVVTLVAMWLGIGMILLELKKHTHRPHYDTKNIK